MKLIKFFILLTAFLTFSCKKENISYNYPDNQDYARNSRGGMLLDKDVVLYGAKKEEENKEAKNENKLAKSKLWKSTVEVVGSLFPIEIIDSESGIIVTRWYQDENAKKRVKINAFVKDGKTKEENIRISVFRQNKVGDVWQDDEREDSDAKSGSLTAKLIRDKIILKATDKK